MNNIIEGNTAPKKDKLDDHKIMLGDLIWFCWLWQGVIICIFLILVAIHFIFGVMKWLDKPTSGDYDLFIFSILYIPFFFSISIYFYYFIKRARLAYKEKYGESDE